MLKLFGFVSSFQGADEDSFSTYSRDTRYNNRLQ